MTLKRRILTAQFSLGQNNGSFDAAGNTKLLVKNLRSRATIESTQGGATSFLSQLSLQVWGMKNEDMAAMSTLGLVTGIYNVVNGTNAQTQVVVQAGDDDGMTTVFGGAIYAAKVEYNQQPEVCLTVMASATLGLSTLKMASSSFPGSMDVPSMLQGICSQAGLTLVNQGVTAKLANHCVGGSALDQISDICASSGTCWGISQDGKTVTVWPRGVYLDDSSPISLSPGQGLVGYPEYSQQGIDVQCEFNPNIIWGRKLTVKSSIPTPPDNAAAAVIRQQAGPGSKVIPVGASGTFYVYGVAHELSCFMPDGPWFTQAKLGNTDTRAWR